MNFDIVGNYRWHDIVEPYLDRYDKTRVKDCLDDKLRASYFHSHLEAYNFFQNMYPGAEIEIVPCQAGHPYKEKKKYTRGAIKYIKVTITHLCDLKIFILRRIGT